MKKLRVQASKQGQGWWKKQQEEVLDKLMEIKLGKGKAIQTCICR
jgi:hypothetical protein